MKNWNFIFAMMDSINQCLVEVKFNQWLNPVHNWDGPRIKLTYSNKYNGRESIVMDFISGRH